MLTKKDLQEIKTVVEESFDQKFPGAFTQAIKPIRNDIKRLRTEVKDLFNYLDKDVVFEKKRTDRIVEHLDLPKDFGYEP